MTRVISANIAVQTVRNFLEDGEDIVKLAKIVSIINNEPTEITSFELTMGPDGPIRVPVTSQHE